MNQQSNEKVNRYFNRTLEHIQRVQRNAALLVTKYRDELGLSLEQCREFMHQVLIHDRSKFSEVQFMPYIELTEYYYQRKTLKNQDYNYPPGVEEEVEKAWVHHYRTENHHPERFAGNCGKYSMLEAFETACDLQAMAQEFNEGTCRGFFENIWKKKQSQHFYDDFNWTEVCYWMNSAIKCFEKELVIK